MSPSSPRFAAVFGHARLASIAAFSLAFAVRLPRAFEAPRAMLSGFVPDDSFYYLTIARHVARGDGITFDGTTPTNGFHPLWAIVTSLLALVFRSDGGLLAASVAVGAAAGAALVAVVDALLHRLEVPFPARGVAVAWLAFHPLAIDLATSAIEAPLHGLFFALVVLVTIEETESSSRLRPVRLGVLVGLLGLARTDSVVLALPAVIPYLGRHDRRSLVRFVLAAAAVVTPWLLLLEARLGGVVQSSAIAYPLLLRKQAEAAGILPGSSEARAHAIDQLYVWGRWCTGWTASRSIPFLFVFAALLACFRSRENVPRSRRLLAWFSVATLATLGGHATFRWLVREWYVSPLLVLLACGLALVTEEAGRLVGKVLPTRFAPAIVALAIFGSTLLEGRYLEDQRPRYPWQGEMYDAAIWVRTHLPAYAVVGSFNAGIEGYFSKRTVINLDGVVDRAAVEAVDKGEVGRYLARRNVEWVVDSAHSVEGEYAPFFGAASPVTLEPDVTLPGSWNDAPMKVYVVTPH